MQKKWADFPEILRPARRDHDKEVVYDKMSLSSAPLAGKRERAPSPETQLLPGAHRTFANFRSTWRHVLEWWPVVIGGGLSASR